MSDLAQRLRATIASEGPITFARFMEEALYDDAEGFYAAPPIGRERHYVTSPHVSVAFAELLAREITRVRGVLGEPFAVVEVGAGDGTLASQIVSLIDVPYLAVDRSAGARGALAERGIAARASLDDVEPFRGVLLANELLDNVPFHRLRRRGDRIVEVYVGVDGDRFVEVEGDVTAEAAGAIVAAPRDGEERPASPGWRSFVLGAARALRQGVALVVDVGFAGAEAPGSVRGYRAQRLESDVLSEPGTRDISTGVDFDALIAAAKDAGFDVWGPVSQRDALLRLGLREWLEALRERQVRASEDGDARTAVRLFAERSRAPMLADPDHLGALKVLALGKGVEAPAFAVD